MPHTVPRSCILLHIEYSDAVVDNEDGRPTLTATLWFNWTTEASMQNKRVLVTGGAGFIGSNIANHLADNNDVIALDDGYLGTPENLNDTVEFVEASVFDNDLPTDVDVLFHLAALSSYKIYE